MSVEDNFALASAGATIVDVSHEALHVASAASNLLLEREEMLWITSDAPQSVVIRVAPNHPPLTYVGWHVWHDYLSNPKIVEVASGVLPDCLNPAIVCNALPGAGTQLWELPNPIPPAHQFVRFTIQATFAPGPTYMNNVCLFAQHPGPKFSRSGGGGATTTLESGGVGTSRNTSVSTNATSRDQSKSHGATTSHGQFQGNGAAAAATAASSGNNHQQAPMSSLLRDLDEDIKALHPIRTVSPTRNVVFSAPSASLPSLVDAEIGEYLAAASRRSPSSTQPQHLASQGNANPHENSSRGVGHHGHTSNGMVAPRSSSPARDALTVVDNTTFRLAALEQAVTSLTRALENQRQDIVSIKELLAQRVAAQPSSTAKAAHRAASHHSSQPISAADIHFPEESLKTFIEDVLGPKLTKHAKRTEAKTLEKLEQHVSSMLDNVADVVDHRVRGYLNHLVGDHGMSALSRLRPESAGDAGRDYSGVSSHRRSTDARSMEHSRDDDAYARPVKPSRHTPRW